MRLVMPSHDWSVKSSVSLVQEVVCVQADHVDHEIYASGTTMSYGVMA